VEYDLGNKIVRLKVATHFKLEVYNIDINHNPFNNNSFLAHLIYV
jgi:hypothetical protein